jgi:hypothetical protein
VDFPTRPQNNSATAIDNIFIDVSLQGNYVVYPLCNGLSDHNAQLIALTELISFIRNIGKGEKKRKIRSRQHYNRQVLNSSNKTRTTWDTVRSVTRKLTNDKTIQELEVNGKIIRNRQNIADF